MNEKRGSQAFRAAAGIRSVASWGSGFLLASSITYAVERWLDTDILGSFPPLPLTSKGIYSWNKLFRKKKKNFFSVLCLCEFVSYPFLCWMMDDSTIKEGRTNERTNETREENRSVPEAAHVIRRFDNSVWTREEEKRFFINLLFSRDFVLRVMPREWMTVAEPVQQQWRVLVDSLGV